MLQMRGWIEPIAQGIEYLAVVIVAAFIAFGTGRWLFHSANRIERAVENFRHMLGKSLLIGLELLVAADIIRSVAIELSLKSLAVLGGLVVVRTFLGWTVTVEVEGRWPWQRARESGSGSTKEAP